MASPIPPAAAANGSDSSPARSERQNGYLTARVVSAVSISTSSQRAPA